MPQQNFHPPNQSDDKQIERKITLLYLVNRVEIPISQSQLVQFALEENYMNFYTVQEYLKEMVDIEYLDSSQDNNTTRYTITGEGLKALEIFSKHLPVHLKNRINKYVVENQNAVKQDYEVVAHHFFEQDTGEYLVKCGVYDGDTMLMEFNMSVVSREQALLICNNWKNDVGSLYSQIVNILMSKKDPESETNQMDEHQ